MKYTIIVATLITFAAAMPVTAAEDAHNHPATGHMQLSLDNGRKWPTDEPLRKGMTQIRASLAGSIEPIHQDKFTAEQYRALGVSIQQQISTIIAQCKLEPQADAMLHIILADLLTDADAMQGKGNMKPATGAHKAVEAINSYGEYFNHPGWHNLP